MIEVLIFGLVWGKKKTLHVLKAQNLNKKRQLLLL